MRMLCKLARKSRDYGEIVAVGGRAPVVSLWFSPGPGPRPPTTNQRPIRDGCVANPTQEVGKAYACIACCAALARKPERVMWWALA